MQNYRYTACNVYDLTNICVMHTVACWSIKKKNEKIKTTTSKFVFGEMYTYIHTYLFFFFFYYYPFYRVIKRVYIRERSCRYKTRYNRIYLFCFHWFIWPEHPPARLGIARPLIPHIACVYTYMRAAPLLITPGATIVPTNNRQN